MCLPVSKFVHDVLYQASICLSQILPAGHEQLPAFQSLYRMLGIPLRECMFWYFYNFVCSTKVDPQCVAVVECSGGAIFLGRHEKNTAWKSRFFFGSLATYSLGRASSIWQSLTKLCYQCLGLGDLELDDKFYTQLIKKLLEKGLINLYDLWS